MRTPLLATLCTLAATGLIAGCGGDDDSEKEATTSAAGNGEAVECVPAEPATPKRVNLKAPKAKVKAGEAVTATVATNCGEFSFELATKDSPKTAASFVQLVEEGVYDGTPFHRVVDGFVIQGGDPSGDGTGGPGYSVTEAPPRNTVYDFGTVAMAKTGVEPAGTSGSQFFVVTAEADAGLPADFAVLGRLTAGEDVVERIEALADPALGPAGGEPLEPVVIETITLERG